MPEDARAPRLADPAEPADVVATGLSPREREILEYLLTGDTEKQIGNRLGISQHTVHVYIKAIYRHYRVDSRPALMARFIPAAARRRIDG